MKRVVLVLIFGLTGCFKTKQLDKPEGEVLKVEKSAFPHAVFDSVLQKVVSACSRSLPHFTQNFTVKGLGALVFVWWALCF